MNKVIFSFFLTAFLASHTGCDGGKSEGGPTTLGEHNKQCLEGKIAGQFIVQTSDGKHHVVSASSQKSFFRKIQSHQFLNKLKKKNLKITGVDFNFKKSSASQEELNEYNPLREVNIKKQKQGLELINAPFLWDLGFWGQGATTALIDSGFDISHRLLQNSVRVNSIEQGNDEDSNNLVGDIYGWDFINNKPLSRDLGSHGTLVGSIINAQHTEKYKFSVAPGSKLIPIAGLRPKTLGTTDASGDSNSVLKSIDYAISRNVDFINASWGGDVCSKFIRNKIKEATDKGIIFVTSAGNENLNLDVTPTFPGSFPFTLLISVGALTRDGAREPDSNYGLSVDFMALGQAVLAASPQNHYSRVTGTSIATPYITGALALLKSAFPDATPEALSKALLKSSNDQKVPDLEQAYYILSN